MRPPAIITAAALVAAVRLCAHPLAAQETLPVVTLDEAVRMSLAVDPRVVAAESAVDDARAGRQLAGGAFLPSLSVGGSYANSSNERLDPTSGNRVSESYTAQTTFGYDLFTGGRRGADRRSAAARLTAAESGVLSQQYAVALETTQAFYASAAADEVLSAARQREARARQQLSFAETRLELGSATRSDVLRAELEVGNARLAVVDAEVGVRTSRLALGRRVGVEGAVRPAPTELPTAAPLLPDPDRLGDFAEAGSPAVRAARAEHRAGEAAVRASRGAYLPSLRATGGYDWFAFDFPPDQRSWSVRLTASLPIFNNFQRETSVTRARASARSADARARAAEVAARSEAAATAEEVRGAGERVTILLRAVELAREDLGVQEERYQLGASTILELQASQIALADAEVAAVRARQALATAVARLESVIGAPLDEIR